MELREATAADAPAVQRVARAAWHAVHDDILGTDGVEELLEEWYDRDSLVEAMGHEESPMFLAVDDDAVVGFAQGGPTEDGPADAVVGRIYVRPDEWGQGYGTALLERLFQAIRADGHDSVWLAVLADNEVGRAFYAKHDFGVHEERTVELAGQEVNDLLLVRDL